MSTKLRGGRLEAEVDRARTEGNWSRLEELLPSIKSKQSGMTEMAELVEAEIKLEQFIEHQGEMRPSADFTDPLLRIESLLLACLKENANSPSVVLEALMLLAKAHYLSANYTQTLKDIENSGMELANTPFRTLRALRLVAEAYVIKGLCLEAKDDRGSVSSSKLSQKCLSCFENAAELTISYISELEKTMASNSSSLKGAAQTQNSSSSGAFGNRQEKIGDLLECCLERVAVLRVKETALEKNSNADGIEWYRRIISCLGDKSTGERLQQKLSRQLAELLLRAVPPEARSSSQALSAKSQNLSFYTGSLKGYFLPSSRTEEIVLLLLISELLSTREVVLSRNDDQAVSRHQSIRNAKSVYNLLTLVLSTIRQYHILCNIYERAMKFANEDIYLWHQFGLSLLCKGRWLRAARVLDQTVLVDGSQAVLQLLLSAQLHIQHLTQFDIAIEHAQKALDRCEGSAYAFLLPRCKLMLAIAHGLQAQSQPCFEDSRRGLSKTVSLFEECIQTDPHDYLSFYYCAFYHALVRDLDGARDRCARSLELNPDQPAAIMLLALLFTADRDLKGALELVVNALKDFPNNYGLLVLRLHIETKYGRIEESLDTCTSLLEFWRKNDLFSDEEKVQQTLSAVEAQTIQRDVQKAGSLGGRDGMTQTSLFGSPLGMALTTPIMASNSQSGMDVSVVDSGVAPSDVGGQSTATDSGLAGSAYNATWTRFRPQANMWLALAELFLSENRISDVVPCVEQAVTLFPHSHQALYLKGRLLAARSESTLDEILANKLRDESKAALLSALTMSPGHTSSLSQLALLYLKENNVKMAEQFYKELVRVDSLNCEWWQQLGCCQMKRNKVEMASESFMTAAKLDRSTPLLPFNAIPLVFPSGF